MSEQETMRLVAEVVDKSTGILKKIQGSYKQLGEEAGKAHETGGKAAREHTKHIRELNERLDKVKDMVSDAVLPAFATMGVTIFGVGEGIGHLAEKIKQASERFQSLNDTVKRGHASSAFVQGMGEAFSRLGMDASRANEFVSETGETLDKLRRGNAGEMQRLTDTFGNTLPWLEKVVAGARNYQEAAERIMKALTDTRIPIDQRRKLAEAFHIDPRIASKNGEEVGEALSKSMAEAVKHGLNMETLSALDDAYTNLGIAQQHFWNDLINKYGPAAVIAIDKVKDATEGLGKLFDREAEDVKALYQIWLKIADFHDKLASHPANGVLGPELPSGKSAFGDLLDQMRKKFDNSPNHNPRSGYHPTAFIEGVGGDRNNPLYRGVRDGVLDAFRQLMGEKVGGAGVSGGFTNASFTTGGGGGRGWGGGGYRSIIEGAEGGGGAGGNSPARSAIDKIGDSLAGRGLTGSDFLKARRERFAKELQDPNVLARVKAMMATEGTGLQSLEAAMNRADYTGKSLAQTLSPSFYGPMRKASFAGIVAAMRNGGGKQYDALVAKALAGSDTIHGYTDQGMPTDPNGSRRNPLTARDHMSVRGSGGLNEFTDWEGGPGGRGAARAYREMIEAHINAEQHGARLSDHIRNHIKNAYGGGKVDSLGSAHIKVDVNAPKGTRTNAKADGIFKSVKLNRGRPMQMASDNG
ncbi:hypothetical protein [Bradyrhizobium elkanii]|uniref:hypothetical protein n=1 Tax=Bradyrhizobium elkanii TaxID=29448 RepID=UPI0023EE3DB3|nr:hypothetical protein [Bradyrhizobium elkanii]MCS3689080.1 hypothetical protein [Bradyrhizobium elkanii]